jgi:hypothetical protein
VERHLGLGITARGTLIDRHGTGCAQAGRAQGGVIAARAARGARGSDRSRGTLLV